MKLMTVRRLAAAVTLAGIAAASPAQAAPAPKASPIRMNATAYYGTLDVIARETLGLKAHFTTWDGRPVANLPIQFTTTGERFPLCEATTDFGGWAECKNGPVPPPVSLANLLVNGYDAVWLGNRRFAPVSAHNNLGIG